MNDMMILIIVLVSIDLHGASVVLLYLRRGEAADLGSYPFAFPGLEFRAELPEAPPVGTPRESADAVAVHLDLNIYVGVFGLAFGTCP